MRPSPLAAACLGVGSAFAVAGALRSDVVRLGARLRAAAVVFVRRVCFGAGVFGRCRRFSTCLTCGIASAFASSSLICSGVLASPRSHTTPSAVFTSILPFATELSRNSVVSTLWVIVASSSCFGLAGARRRAG